MESALNMRRMDAESVKPFGAYGGQINPSVHGSRKPVNVSGTLKRDALAAIHTFQLAFGFAFFHFRI
jgi:hypothetical protein